MLVLAVRTCRGHQALLESMRGLSKGRKLLLLVQAVVGKKITDSGGIRTHALADWCLKPAPQTTRPRCLPLKVCLLEKCSCFDAVVFFLTQIQYFCINLCLLTLHSQDLLISWRFLTSPAPRVPAFGIPSLPKRMEMLWITGQSALFVVVFV